MIPNNQFFVWIDSNGRTFVTERKPSMCLFKRFIFMAMVFIGNLEKNPVVLISFGILGK